MLVTSDDGSERGQQPASELTENVIPSVDEDNVRRKGSNIPPQHHFARAYAQQDEGIIENYYADASSSPFWLRLQRWFLVNTFTPQWLPRPMQRVYVGYFISLLLQGLAIVSTLLLLHLFPTFAFSALLEILAIAFVALNFGTAPSLLATLVSLVLLNIIVLLPVSGWDRGSIGSIQYGIENVLFLIVGITVSIGASQVERARRSAYAERTLFNAVIETVPDSVSVFDAQGRLVRLNEAGRRLEREQSYEPLGRSYTTGNLRTSEGKPLRREQLPVIRALRGESVASMEMLWRDAAQNTHNLSVSAAPLYDALQRISGAVSVSHDVTTLRRSQEKTATSVGELDAVFESIADGVFIFKMDGEIFQMNAAFRSLIGVSSIKDYFSHSLDERLRLFQLLSEDGHPLPFEQWPQNRILRGETLKGATSVDVLLHTRDERDIFLSISGAPVRTQQGKLIGGVMICRDITERRRMEQYTHTALQGLLAMAQTLVQDIASPSSEQANEDTDNVDKEAIIAVEQRMAELTGHVLHCKRVGIIAVEPRTHRLIPVAVSGLTAAQERLWWEHVPQMRPETAPDMLALLQRLHEGEVIAIDVAQVPGAYLYDLFSSRSILVAPMVLRNEFMGFILLDNANEEHVYNSEEQVLAGTVARLAALIIEREQLLRERATAQANEIALREANQRMNEFLGIASHELKTPITTIKGSVQLLERRLKRLLALENASLEERTRLKDESENLLQRTGTQVSRLTRLIEDLLDVSRIQENRLKTDLEPHDIVSIVRDAVQMQQQNNTERTITLEIVQPQSFSPISVLADASRVEQVITNYLSNALKYSPSNTPITVSLSADEHMAHVAVHDEGVGIPEEEQPHVWERFYRVPNIEVQTGSGVGLGLGLYICKTIIELHQGEVGVQSEPGEGSTFWFTLPLLGEN